MSIVVEATWSVGKWSLWKIYSGLYYAYYKEYPEENHYCTKEELNEKIKELENKLNQLDQNYRDQKESESEIDSMV